MTSPEQQRGGQPPCNDEEDPDELLQEARTPHMSRPHTEARSRASAAWIANNVRPEYRYRPSPGACLRRQHLRSTKKELPGRHYQFLSGQAAIGSYLRGKIHKIDSDRF